MLTSSLRPSGVTPMLTSRHWRASSKTAHAAVDAVDPFGLQAAHHIGRQAGGLSLTSTASASRMSPLETPFRYSQGSAAEMRPERRA